jgi:hypothetical protein
MRSRLRSRGDADPEPPEIIRTENVSANAAVDQPREVGLALELQASAS